LLSQELYIFVTYSPLCETKTFQVVDISLDISLLYTGLFKMIVGGFNNLSYTVHLR